MRISRAVCNSLLTAAQSGCFCQCRALPTSHQSLGICSRSFKRLSILMPLTRCSRRLASINRRRENPLAGHRLAFRLSLKDASSAPAQNSARAQHCGAQIAAVAQPARRNDPTVTLMRSPAAHWRCRNFYVASRKIPLGTAQKSYQSIAGLDPRGTWTRVACPTSSVEFACGNAPQSDPRPFRAPDRTVSIPNRNRRADERGTCGQRQ